MANPKPGESIQSIFEMAVNDITQPQPVVAALNMDSGPLGGTTIG